MTKKQLIVKVGLLEDSLANFNNVWEKAEKERKSLIFNEAQLLEGLTPKKVHADEIVDIHHREFEEHE